MRAYLYYNEESDMELLLDKLHIAHGHTNTSFGQKYSVIYWAHRYDVGKDPIEVEGGHPFILNPPDKVKRLEEPGANWRAQLRLGGQNVEQASGNERDPSSLSAIQVKEDYTREFMIPVFHLQALAVFEKKGRTLLASHVLSSQKNTYREIDLSVRQYYVNKAMQESVRALYALGLDFGVVFIGVDGEGNIVIRDMQAIPRLNERMAELYAEAIHRFDEQLQTYGYRSPDSLMIGADPEFILRNSDGHLVLASKYLERHGAVGCDSIMLPNRQRLFSLAELRPGPAEKPVQLVYNIHKTMKMASKLIPDPDLEWLAGGMPIEGYPLGGHIHLSGVWLNSTLLRVLDNYLTLPLMLLEDVSTVKRRPRYGFLGDFRRKSHGGFEYRTPPSWILSPFIAAGVLTLTKVLVDHYFVLRELPLQSAEVQAYYYRGQKSELLPIVRNLWDQIEYLPNYATYAKFLNPFKSRVLRMESWQEDQDIRTRWKLIK